MGVFWGDVRFLNYHSFSIKRAAMLISSVVRVIQYVPNLNCTYRSWPVLIWLVHVSSSSCKGTFKVLHFMGSNTIIFAVLKAPLHCVIN